jgi:hypothetical protein
MNDFRRWIVLVPFGLALIAPVMNAAPDHDRDSRTHRYYDQDRKDYHNWNANEQRYWGAIGPASIGPL